MPTPFMLNPFFIADALLASAALLAFFVLPESLAICFLAPLNSNVA